MGPNRGAQERERAAEHAAAAAERASVAAERAAKAAASQALSAERAHTRATIALIIFVISLAATVIAAVIGARILGLWHW